MDIIFYPCMPLVLQGWELREEEEEVVGVGWGQYSLFVNWSLIFSTHQMFGLRLYYL